MRTTRARSLLAAMALAPALTAVLTVRPAVGQQATFGLYSLTAVAGSMALDGDVGAGGGLAVVDGGVPYAAGRLDSSPSSSVRTSAVEPGTLVRTVAGVANTEAGETVVDVPIAEASSPGGAEEDAADLLGSETVGPLTMTGLTARSVARPTAIRGDGKVGELVASDGAEASAALLRAGLASLRAAYPELTGARSAGEDDEPAALRMSGGDASIRATADDGAGILEASARSVVGRVTVLDEIVVDDVVGTATVRVEDGRHTATAGVTVGGVTIGGVPFALGSQGLVFAGESVFGSEEVAAFNAEVNAVLRQAGIGFDVLTPLVVEEERAARADSRGLRITVTSPPLADGGVPGNDLTVIVGGAAVTVADEPPFSWGLPEPTRPPIAGGPASQPPAPPAPATPDAVGGDRVAVPPPAPAPGPSATEGEAPPVVAPEQPPVASPPVVMVAGRTVSRRAALGAFAAWQLLSMTTVGMAALTLGRRP